MPNLPLPKGATGLLTRFLGSSFSTAAGVAIGEALSPVLETRLQTFKNDQWKSNAHVPPDVGAMATAVAHNKVLATTGAFYASQHGIGQDQFDALVANAKQYPSIGDVLAIQRRSGFDDGTYFSPGQTMIDYLMKHGLSSDDAYVVAKLLPSFLSPSEVANAVQQGHLANVGADGNAILPTLDTAVTPFPRGAGFKAPDGAGPMSIPLTQLVIDPITQAEASGIDPEQLRVLANLAGLPPGQHELLQMWNRGLIDEASVDAGIREGHTKTKWIAPFKRLRWSVLSELQYVEARVRGWITNAELYAGGELTGYTPAQLDLLHSTHGRPLSFRDVQRGLARGGVRLDPVADFTGANPIAADGSKVAPINDTLFKALQQSNIQQQWYDLARHMATNPPGLFMLNRLALAFPEYIPQAVLNLGYLGIDATDITWIEKYWNAQTGAAAKVKKETEAQLMQQFLAGVLSQAALTTALTGMGYSVAQAGDLIATAEFKAASAERTRATRLLEKRFVAAQISQPTAEAELLILGWPQGVVDGKIAAWIGQRDYQLTTLTVSQIEKALSNLAILASQARPLLADLGEDAAAIETIIATSGANPAT